ncbi:MAG: hypothetical protein ACI4OZ_10035, partial [Akkermansia sp.]
MRLHLPKRLLHAVLTALVTTSAAYLGLGSTSYAGMGTGANANTFYLNGTEADAQGDNESYCEWSSGSVYTSITTNPEGVTSVINTIAAGDINTATINTLYLPAEKNLIISAGGSNGFTEGDGLTIKDIQIAGDNGTATMKIAANQIVTLGSVSQGSLDVIFEGGNDNYNRKLQIKDAPTIALRTITNSWGLEAIDIESGCTLTATTISFASGNNGSGDMQGGKITGAGAVEVETFSASNVGSYTISVASFKATTINAGCHADRTLTLSSNELTVDTLNQTEGKVVLNSADAVISNLLFNGGTLTNNGILNITGKFKGGTLTNTGTLTFASGCVIDISGMTFETRFFDSAESDGYVDCRAAHQVVSGTAATNQGVIIKNGDTEVAGASFDGTYVYNTADRGYLLMDNDSYDTSTLKSGNGAEGSVGVASEASYLKIASGKTLTVNSTDWTLAQIYGEGNVSIASDLEYSTGPSKATGQLDIASDVQLTIGGGTSSNANLNSFTSISIDGGTLKLNFKQGTFNNVTVSA